MIERSEEGFEEGPLRKKSKHCVIGLEFSISADEEGNLSPKIRNPELGGIPTFETNYTYPRVF